VRVAKADYTDQGLSVSASNLEVTGALSKKWGILIIIVDTDFTNLRKCFLKSV